MSGHVLVVDDDASIRQLVALTLRTEAIPVRTARGGEEAVRAILDDPPALVVLDVMMPEVDGWEVMERLSRIRGAADVPVVFLTACTSDADLARGRALGAVGYVSKPFDIADLVEIVHEILAAAA